MQVIVIFDDDGEIVEVVQVRSDDPTGDLTFRMTCEHEDYPDDWDFSLEDVTPAPEPAKARRSYGKQGRL